MRLMRTGAVAATAVGLALFAGACSSNDKSTATQSSTASASQAPEDVKAPAAEVTAGLHQIQDITGQVAQAVGSDKATASDLNEQIEPVWEKIEGTVKSNDSEAYITFEDSFAALGKAVDSGDSAKAQEAATTVASDCQHLRRGVSGLTYGWSSDRAGGGGRSGRPARHRAPCPDGLRAVHGRLASRGDQAARRRAPVHRPNPRPHQARPGSAGVRRGEEWLPEPLRVRRGAVAGGRPDAHVGRGDEVRGDPWADHRQRIGRRDPLEHRRPPRSDRRLGAAADGRRIQRARGGVRSVLPHHLPRGTRSGAAGFGAARLSRSGQGHAVPATDSHGHGGRRRRHGGDVRRPAQRAGRPSVRP